MHTLNNFNWRILERIIPFVIRPPFFAIRFSILTHVNNTLTSFLFFNLNNYKRTFPTLPKQCNKFLQNFRWRKKYNFSQSEFEAR